MEEFCEYLFGGENKGRIAISHAGRIYDNHFVLNFLVRHSIKINRVIMRGFSILTLKALGVTLMDSHAHIPLPLRVLPKTFNFENEAQKGTFPFLVSGKKANVTVCKKKLFSVHFKEKRRLCRSYSPVGNVPT